MLKALDIVPAAEESGVGALIAALRERIGSRCSTALSDREHHGHGESYHGTRLPDAVCFALTTEEVSDIVKLCVAHDVPMVPFGAGTSLEGHVIALRGGIALDVSRMNAILSVRPDDLDVTVQAGVTRQQLNAELRDTGLFFPVDPGAEATLGGMAATRASGTNAVRYGTMRENVLNLTVVLADGTIIRTASRARKSSAGYDLTRLFVGSEGTLGIITEVTLKLYGIPETISAAVCPFETVEGAVATVIQAIQSGIPVARMELLDAATIRCVNAFSNLKNPEAPTLFLEFHGMQASVAEQAELFSELAKGNGAGEMQWSSNAEERARLWHARHNLHYAMLATRPGAKIWGTDTCVPISALSECIEKIKPLIEKAPFFVSLAGHVGDGNFHLGMVIDPASEEEMAYARKIGDRVVEIALSLDGTCTGEHGVGSGKIRFMNAEHGEGVAVMRLIKQALDPRNLLNPGKILPEA
ncbi:FAD-linked oxidase C-terminal domain-containing protein [Rhizobium sp. YK2]|uniref:FAD-binding oxidoreductase n=1 Tax=Rhizobium sp. YK2 TaxID=1860096 RepID=UPI00084CE43F|nr:FAD-linked oxidase C-terminal domain-containing protein [Rhizobium sp. YK2]OED00822.1 lactate dehydrogenase [Rhizobium sp. YK2]